MSLCWFQDDLVQFCRLQMAVHHPEGAVDEASGAFAVDWDVWKVNWINWAVFGSVVDSDLNKDCLQSFEQILSKKLSLSR